MWTVVFFILGFAGAIGLALGIVMGGGAFLYALPYLGWLGWNSGSKGIPRKHASGKRSGWAGIALHCQNATKLYRSRMTKEPHGITKF